MMDCCHRPPASLRESVFDFAREQYGTEPEFLWRDTPDTGILPAYHMNKRHWITILLDGTVPLEEICGLLDMSYDQTARKRLSDSRSSKPKRIITEWLIPANPKYYDVEQAFREQDEILWKQGRSIGIGNTIFLYMGAPVSSILFRCKVTAVNIPYDNPDDCVPTTQIMRIKRLQTYPHGEFSLTRMRSLGVWSVRGPRGLSNGLRHALAEVEQDN